MAIPVDFSQRDAIQPCVERIVSHFPDVNILVNNAAIGASQNDGQYRKAIKAVQTMVAQLERARQQPFRSTEKPRPFVDSTYQR